MIAPCSLRLILWKEHREPEVGSHTQSGIEIICVVSYWLLKGDVRLGLHVCISCTLGNQVLSRKQHALPRDLDCCHLSTRSDKDFPCSEIGRSTCHGLTRS